MGVHILSDHYQKHAVLFCSTTDWAFGPVFGDSEDHLHDAEERAEAFLRWLDATDTWWTYERHSLPSGRRDVRQLTDSGLERAYSDWRAQEAEQWAREEAAQFAED